MAPEQLRGGAVDPRADIYSLAVMAYEMLTGRLPFGAGSFVDVAVRQESDDPSLDATPLPERLAGVLRRALSIDPAKRPPTAVAFATELRQVPCPTDPSVHRRQLPVDFRDRVLDLFATHGMRRRFELALQLGARQAQRLERTGAFRVDLRPAIPRGLAAFFEFFHALLQARVGVDQSFSSITH